ncbi:MAG TPA: tRNA (N6-isopentenyl adenosine(37)-C2)-methylthiotransferase MiaB [Papillibacter sp.]|nr:tRNA (N6-isopentenyl adenosine(37)-C2)-methylthiotransferase MiaB [Papillibacter sp.]
MERVRRLSESIPHQPLAFVDTYGCQQNEADSEKIRGMLSVMGYGFTQSESEADVIVINTCAVRENAEHRVLGNIGALVHTKRAKPSQIIAVCGCMVQQEHITDTLRRSYRHVDLVFGPQALWRFPELLEKMLTERGRLFETAEEPGVIAEGLPVRREGSIKAWLSIMVGCNNFCSYCIVPYVRGRERSRRPEKVIEEARELIAEGYKDITLLGQNVNSYGRGADYGVDFPELLSRLSELDGSFLLRFMTSHPKDASEHLFQVMAESPKIARHIHLPFQAGSDRILKAMNRNYTKARYLELIDMARHYMPDIILTSDVIVGFPGETQEDFEETMSLLRTVRFDALFTFIYSKREGTPAAKMEDGTPRDVIQARFDELVALQDAISAEKHAAFVGKTLKVLVDGETGDARYPLSARTNGNRLIRLTGAPSAIGSFVQARVTDSNKWSLFGEIL